MVNHVVCLPVYANKCWNAALCVHGLFKRKFIIFRTDETIYKLKFYNYLNVRESAMAGIISFLVKMHKTWIIIRDPGKVSANHSDIKEL